MCLEVQDRVQNAVAAKLDWKQAHKQQEQNNARVSKHKRTEPSQNASTINARVSKQKRHNDDDAEGLGHKRDWLGVAGRPGSGNGNGGP